MKYLKLFEDVSKMYKVGDYAIATIRTFYEIKYENVLVQIKKITLYGPNRGIRVKKLDDKTTHLIDTFRISYWSESKEELEAILAANKYNL